MKSRLIQIATFILLLGGTGLAGAAEAEATRQASQPASQQVSAPASEQDGQLAWQRVGAQETGIG